VLHSPAVRTFLRRSAVVAGVLFLAGAVHADAGDLTVFAAQARPDGFWRSGFGATLGASLLGLAAVEAEAARFDAEIEGGDMTSFSASVMVAPAIGPVVPFVGVGVGVYRQNLGQANTTDVLGSFAAGLKVNIGRVFVLRGEYRRFDLSGPVRIAMDERFSVGAGIQF